MEGHYNKLKSVMKKGLTTALVTGLIATSLGLVFAQTYNVKPIENQKKSISTLVRASHLLKSSASVVDSSVDVFRLTVDNEHVLFFISEEEATKTLDLLKASYLTDDNNIQSVSFVEDVVVTAEQVSIYDFDKYTSYKEAIEYIKTGSLEKETYSIKKGDTLEGIARERDMKLSDVLAANPDLDEETILHIDQEINLVVPKPIISVKTVEVETEQEAVDYEVINEKTDELYVDDTKIVTEGKRGQSEIESIVTYVNGLEESRKLVSENIITKPIDEVVLVGTKKRPVGAATGNFQRPMGSYTITSPFGPRGGGFHNGIDLANSIGTSVYAADGGTVTYAGWRSSYGYLIIIDHGNGLESYYAHLSSVYVSQGQAVSQGTNIGASGNTGRSTGPHLHFEIRVNGTPVNPTRYVGL